MCASSYTGHGFIGRSHSISERNHEIFWYWRLLAKECDFAYNATHMALQWDALATGDTKIMLAASMKCYKSHMVLHGLLILVAMMILV